MVASNEWKFCTYVSKNNRTKFKLPSSKKLQKSLKFSVLNLLRLEKFSLFPTFVLCLSLIIINVVRFLKLINYIIINKIPCTLWNIIGNFCNTTRKVVDDIWKILFLQFRNSKQFKIPFVVGTFIFKVECNRDTQTTLIIYNEAISVTNNEK